MKRHFIRALSVAIYAVAAASGAYAQSSPAKPMAPAADMAKAPVAFTLPSLPYAFDALNPVIDTQTMMLHHGKHHLAQVDALNKAVAADPKLQGKTLEALLASASQQAPAVRNNAGGHWNHSFYWGIMAPPAQSGAPSKELAAAITKSFGTMDAFKTAFQTAGAGRFGSGWVWLVVKVDGTLAITSTPNQDNPLMDVADVRGQPILGNDVWEHAYYLTYQNRRGEYLSAWWQVVNWKAVSDHYAKAIKAVKPAKK
jgi:superoxide dismutase, Fe-Mn family